MFWCKSERAEEKTTEGEMWENLGKVELLRGKQKDARKMQGKYLSAYLSRCCNSMRQQYNDETKCVPFLLDEGALLL